MSEHKRNKSGLPKKNSSIFEGVSKRQNFSVHKPCGAPEQQRAVGTEPEQPDPEPQVPQTAKLQTKRTFQQHGIFARFNKRKAKAMAKAEEKLRAAVERKVKAEAEKMLLTQHRRYSVLAERVDAQAKEEIATAKAEAKEAVEKARSYAAALAQAEKKLAKAKEQVKAEAIARAKAEKDLLVSAKAEATAGKPESKERERIEAQAKEDIAAAKAQAEEKVRSYAAALAQAEEKLAKAKEKAKTEAIARAKAEKALLVSAKAEAAAGKAESKKRESIEVQPVKTTKTIKRIRQYVFHPGVIKKSKFTLIAALAIFSTIAFTVSIIKNPPTPSYAGAAIEENPPVAIGDAAITQEGTPVQISLMGSDSDGKKLTDNVVTTPSHDSLSGTAPSMTYTPALNYNGPGSYVSKVKDGNSIPALDTQSSTITLNPALPKIAKLTVLDGYNQRNRKILSADGKTKLVQSSDNNRWAISFGSYTSYDFPDIPIPKGVAITSVVVFVEHFEEERFAQGKLEWAIGTGWPTKPVVWAAINAPVHEGQSLEAVDSWDVTNITDTREKINSLQLQVKNNDNVAYRKTLIDYIYVIVEWD
jgi:hypothetical protein